MSSEEAPQPTVSTVPSELAIKNIDAKYFDFSSYEESIAEAIESFDLDSLPQFNENPVSSIYKDIVAEIDKLTLNQLVTEPTKLVQDFNSYFISKIQTKSFYVVTNVWPPCIPTPTPEVEGLFKLLIKMLHESHHPEKFLSYVMCSLIPRNWSSSSINGAVAASLVKSDNNTVKWAVLESEGDFSIQEENKGNMKTTFKGKAAKFTASEDGNIVLVFDDKDKEINKFEPVDQETVQYWTKVFDEENKPSIFRTFTSTSTIYPDAAYTAIVSLISDSSMVTVRSLVSILKGEELKTFVRNALEVAEYTQKTTLFIGAFLTAVFENPASSIDSLISPESPLHALYEAFIKKHGQNYVISFISKLVKYIDGQSEIEEKQLFTALQYVIASAGLVPPEIQHLASMVRSFATTKFNSKDATCRILGDLMKFLVCGPLSNPQEYGIDVLLQHPDHFTKTAEFIGHSLLLVSIPEHKARLDRRSSAIEAFVLSAGDIMYGEGETREPPYTPAPAEAVAACAGLLLELIAGVHTQAAEEFELLSLRGTFATSQAGWALAAALCAFFADSTPNAEQNPPAVPPLNFVAPLLPHAPTAAVPGRPYGVGESKPVIVNDGDKQYIKVKRRTRKVLHGEDGGEVVAVEVIKEEKTEDGSHKTVVKKKVRRVKDSPPDSPVN